MTTPVPAPAAARPTDCTELFALYELRGLKGHEGDDSYCFSATLHYKKKAVGHASNDGNGGAHRIDFYRAITPKPSGSGSLTEAQRRMMRDAEAQFQAATALLPAHEIYDPNAVNVDEIIDVLVDRVKRERRGKTHTQIRTRMDVCNLRLAEYRAVMAPDEIRLYLLKDFTAEERTRSAVWITGRGWVQADDLLRETAPVK